MLRGTPLATALLFVATTLFAPSFTALAAAAETGEPLDELIRQGYDLAYNLDHDEAVVVLKRAIDSAPDNPAPYRAVAAVT
jgi:hypothetical protein